MIYPVILAGGSGTRLWPVSRKSHPKQFSKLSGDLSLFQTTLKRVRTDAFCAPIVLTGEDYRFLVCDQLEEMEVAAHEVLIEPEGRNTAPAILTAALALSDTPDAIMLVMPSDHAIQNTDRFFDAVLTGEAAANAGDIVTFGVAPTRPETGYGYLKVSEQAAPEGSLAKRLIEFIEKPSLEVAQDMIASGQFLWNAGMFMFKVSTLLDEVEKHAPHLILPCRAALKQAKRDLGFTRLHAESYRRVEDISIDYAVMEKAKNLVVAEIGSDWCDLGSWKSVHSIGDADPDGNVVSENTTSIDCKNSLLRSEGGNVRMVGVGLENIAAVAMGDAVLIADMNRSEDVKLAVEELKVEAAPQAEEFPRCYRPWGYYESLSLGKRFQVKRIMVRPGAALSLQSHVHRSEHWIVVEGSAKVTVDDDVKLVTENQSVYIPLGAVHRLENPGKVPLNLIEVQSGAYLGEDDIIRYEDVYDRVKAA